jgi:NAD(P)-dependent dehydrogenase (short-subunit alcohol dehydrogenase family)
MDLGLDGKVALVAGGGRGIGRAVARALAREGAHVAVAARGQDDLDKAAAEVRAAGRKAATVAVDLGTAGAADQALAATRTLGPPTLLVLCAAVLYEPKKLHHVSDAEIATALSVDVGAALALCRAFLPDMMLARFGRIVAVGSLAARTGIAGATLYGAAKAALEGLVRGLAVDYTRRGITANVVAAGFTETERLQQRLGDETVAATARERLTRATATRRLLAPEEVADVVTFLCSPRAGGITGAVVDVTGGAHLNNLW